MTDKCVIRHLCRLIALFVSYTGLAELNQATDTCVSFYLICHFYMILYVTEKCIIRHLCQLITLFVSDTGVAECEARDWHLTCVTSFYAHLLAYCMCDRKMRH